MRKIYRLVIIFSVLALVTSFGVLPLLSADTTPSVNPKELNLQDAFTTRDGNICQGGDTLDCVADKAGFNTSKVGSGDGNDTIEPIIRTVLNIVLSLLGIIFIAFIIYGGWEWFSARGNEQKLDRAKDTLTQAIIGLLIVLGAYAMSYFVLNIFIPYLK